MEYTATSWATAWINSVNNRTEVQVNLGDWRIFEFTRSYITQVDWLSNSYLVGAYGDFRRSSKNSHRSLCAAPLILERLYWLGFEMDPFLELMRETGHPAGLLDEMVKAVKQSVTLTAEHRGRG